MIRRVRLRTGYAVHASNEVRFNEGVWTGRTLCGRQFDVVLVSHEMPGAGPHWQPENSMPVTCRQCRRRVVEMIDRLQNALAGFSV